MSSFDVVYEAGSTFQNYQWTINDATVGSKNSFSSIGIEIYLGMESTFESYKTWLNTAGQANSIVDEGEDQLLSSVLTDFKTQINDYDGYAIFMYVDHDAFTVQQ